MFSGVLTHAVAVLAAAKLVFALQDVVIKEMSQTYAVHQIIVIRSVSAFPVLLGLVLFTHKSLALNSPRKLLLLLRGVLMAGAFLFFYLALSALPLTTVTVLFFTAPFFIMVFSIPVLGERVEPSRWLAVIVGFVGVVIVIRPDTASFGVESTLPVIAAVLYAACQVLARRVATQESAAVMTFYANVAFLAFGIVLALALEVIKPDPAAGVSVQFLLRTWSMPDPIDLLFLVLTGVSMGIGFALSTQAYRVMEAHRLAPFEYIMLLWVVLLSYLAWSELPDVNTMVGSLIIIGSGLYVLRRSPSIID
jgi:drug/metabolite transporter (DMT)-like permease